MTTTISTPPVTPAGRAPRRRLVLWVSLGVAALLAAFVAVLASSSGASNQETLSGSPLVGKPAPPVEGPDQYGKTVTLTALRGRWVVLNFAASWCPPCQQETPQLLTFAARNTGPSAPMIVTVDEDQSDLSSLRRFLAVRHAAWPVVDDAAASPQWGVEQLPQSFVIDPTGTVVALVSGEADADALQKLIASYSTTAQ